MSLRIKLSSFPSLNKPSRRSCAREAGYALLILMMMATVLLVSLTVALPSVYLEGQREREEELIFRGTEYARAIALFRRQFNRFPASVDELTKTNGIRFLRRAYPDPMTRSGKWRFIHANAAGAIIDSKTQPRFGGGLGTPVGSAMNSQSPGQSGNAQTPLGGAKGQAQPATPGEAKQETSSFFGPSQGGLGTFIVGVASSSTRESIRVLNNRTHYSEWEFLGIGENTVGVPQNLTPQPGAPGQPGAFGQPAMGPKGPQPGTGQPFSLR